MEMIPRLIDGDDSFGILIAAIIHMMISAIVIRKDIRYWRVQNQKNPDSNFCMSSSCRDIIREYKDL